MEKGFQNGPFHLKVKSTLMGQLADLGLMPKDIEMVGISHYHFDHTGNLNNFTSSKVLIQKEEYDAAYSKNVAKFGFKPESYAKIDKKNYQVVDGDHDVFGDGSVVILKTVGHTPGHQSLLIRLKGQKRSFGFNTTKSKEQTVNYLLLFINKINFISLHENA